ncbi:MAG TPA: ribulose-phosphate 3-epimerase [Clostridia bacterium]|nr:ribulose-phosphate 3-epimerase [Clostridia bacterium]
MIKIAPSILASDFSKLAEEVARVEKAGADIIHIDIMDGHFVPNITVGPVVVQSLRKVTKLPFDVHLMIEDPDRYIEQFLEAGANIITVHAEGNNNLHRTLQLISSGGARPSVALNPATPLSVLDSILNDIDMVLIMTVNPGFGGQQYIEGMTEKVRTLRQIAVQRRIKLDIEVDGGIDAENIYMITEAGANIIVAGSTIYNAPDAAEIIRILRQRAYGGIV